MFLECPAHPLCTIHALKFQNNHNNMTAIVGMNIFPVWLIILEKVSLYDYTHLFLTCHLPLI